MKVYETGPLYKEGSITNGRFRNLPCPCGSGRKAKHCCLPGLLIPDEPTAVQLAAAEKRARYTKKRYERSVGVSQESVYGGDTEQTHLHPCTVFLDNSLTENY